ncbi:MAG: hypothetical protein M3Z65_00825 [Chloroflexota bacterium]|nr:hypothetical protein [Chloroflexota bacterium]
MPKIRLWLSGVAVAMVSVPLWNYAAELMMHAVWLSVALAVIVIGLVTFVVLRRPWPAGGAGVLVGVGVWFVFVLIDGANRCAASGNRIALSRSCQLGDNTLQNTIAICFLASGLGLTAYLAWTERGSRPSERSG